MVTAVMSTEMTVIISAISVVGSSRPGDCRLAAGKKIEACIAV